ncbi:MAG: hypothetical protein ACRDJ2_14960 [Actinomycetota bacterium]
MGDGSALQTYPTPFGHVGGLTCWENYMPLTRLHLCSQGVDVWFAPTLAAGRWLDRDHATHCAGGSLLRGRHQSLLHVDQILPDFPNRDRVGRIDENDEEKDWQEPGNSVIVCPKRGDSRWAEQARRNHPVPELDLAAVHSARRMFDPVGHYH